MVYVPKMVVDSVGPLKEVSIVPDACIATSSSVMDNMLDGN